MKRIFIFSMLVFVGCFVSKPTADEIAKADYGSYPHNYKEIVNKWIFINFFDPHSVQDLVITEPKEDHHSQWLIDGGGTIFGYSVWFRLRAKNRVGGYTGLSYYYLLIRNGEIVYQIEIPR